MRLSCCLVMFVFAVTMIPASQCSFPSSLADCRACDREVAFRVSAYMSQGWLL